MPRIAASPKARQPNATPKVRVAFGPVMPGWGSWEWLGEDILARLEDRFACRTFGRWEVPDADVVVLIKQRPPSEWVARLEPNSALIYAPVDEYGSVTEIEADGSWLRVCARIIVHCERLRRYFSPYAAVEYLDHHVKFARTPVSRSSSTGQILWVGVRTNLPPLVEWLESNQLPLSLVVMTQSHPEDQKLPPEEFAPLAGRASFVRWSPQAHHDWLSRARLALDIKGADFRSRNKPPAKAIDFIASGLPLAMNVGSSATEHLAQLGFELASPHDPHRWLAPRYAAETRRFGRALRELCSPARISWRWARMIDAVVAERLVCGT